MTIDWKLVSNEIQIYRSYACRDAKPGLSRSDVAQLLKNQPTLFQDVLQAYQRLAPSASAASPVRLFHDQYLGTGGIHFLRAVGAGVRHALDMPPAKGATSVLEPDPDLRLDSLRFMYLYAGKRPSDSELSRIK